MKAELTLPPELIKEIALEVAELLKPILTRNGKNEDKDTIFDIKTLAKYLKVSPKWIYKRTQFNEIPYYKAKGLLRFRKKDIDKWLEPFKVPVISIPEGILRAIK